MKKILYCCLLAFHVCKAQDIPVTVIKFSDGVAEMPSQTGNSGGSAYMGLRMLSQSNFIHNYATLGIHTLIAKEKMGIGINFMGEEQNIIQKQNLNFLLAYHLPLKNNRSISFGLNTEYHRITLNSKAYTSPVDLSDIYIVNFTPKSLIEFSPAISFNTRKWYIGSTFNRIRSLLKIDKEQVYLNSFVSLFSSYKYWFSENKHLLEPFVILRFDPVQNRTWNDYQLFGTFNKLIMAGLGLRNEKSLLFSVGYIFSNRLVLGYTYTAGQNNPTTLNGMSANEIIIRINFNKQYYRSSAFLEENKPLRSINTEK